MMEITKDHSIIVDGQIKGRLTRYCCGMDLRLNDRPDALFSILGVRSFSDSKLKTCVKAILSIQIPEKKSFHWNFKVDIAKNKEALKAYELHLNQNEE